MAEWYVGQGISQPGQEFVMTEIHSVSNKVVDISCQFITKYPRRRDHYVLNAIHE
jgi:hypothetical protein